ncbi:MAG: tail fiber protein [Saprospiraceae bacterium]
MRSLVFTFILFAGFLPRLCAQSQPPMSIQGTLKNSDGTSVADGRYNFTFRLYTASGGGTAIWTETQNNIPVRGGVYSAQLGNIVPINIAFTENMFLGTTVGTGAELLPRTRLTSSPYALYAFKLGNAIPIGFVMPFAGALDKVPTGWMLCDGRALKSTEYAELFSAIGPIWGNGSTGAGAGAGTDFNLPDLRGEFVRGTSAGANAGAQQASATARPTNPFTVAVDTAGSHTHTLSSLIAQGRVDGGNNARWPWNANGWYSGGRTPTYQIRNYQFPITGLHTHTVPQLTGGDKETRPRNIAMGYLIKVKD